MCGIDREAAPKIIKGEKSTSERTGVALRETLMSRTKCFTDDMNKLMISAAAGKRDTVARIVRCWRWRGRVKNGIFGPASSGRYALSSSICQLEYDHQNKKKPYNLSVQGQCPTLSNSPNILQETRKGVSAPLTTLTHMSTTGVPQC